MTLQIYGFVPLEPTFPDPYRLKVWVSESGIEDKNQGKKHGKIWVGFSSTTGHITSPVVWIQNPDLNMGWHVISA